MERAAAASDISVGASAIASLVCGAFVELWTNGPYSVTDAALQALAFGVAATVVTFLWRCYKATPEPPNGPDRSNRLF